MRARVSPYHLVILLAAALVAFAIFVGLSWTTGEGVDNRVKIWDLVLKALAGFLTLIGAALAAFRYLDDRAKETSAALLEARKPFLTKRQEVYTDLVMATATISTVENFDAPESAEAEGKFWAVFWGSLPMVTDEDVSRLVDDFSEVLAQRSPEWIRLRNLSMNIARACRASMGFDPPLPKPAPVTKRADARPGP